jgi:hypothetical protein
MHIILRYSASPHVNEWVFPVPPRVSLVFRVGLVRWNTRSHRIIWDGGTQDIDGGYPQNSGIARRKNCEHRHAARAGSLCRKKRQHSSGRSRRFLVAPCPRNQPACCCRIVVRCDQAARASSSLGMQRGPRAPQLVHLTVVAQVPGSRRKRQRTFPQNGQGWGSRVGHRATTRIAQAHPPSTPLAMLGALRRVAPPRCAVATRGFDAALDLC